MNSILRSLAVLVSVFVTSISIAQDAEPGTQEVQQVEKQKNREAREGREGREGRNDFKIDWTATASLYSLDAGNIFVIDNRFSTDITKEFTVGIGVPVINNQNDAVNGGLTWQLNNGGPEYTGTGFSDIDFFVAYDLWEGKCSFFDANAQVDLIGGVLAPIDGNFSSSDPVFYIGGIGELSKDKWTFTQGIKWQIVEDYTFNPVFGGFINGDVLALDTKFMYAVNNGMKLGVVADQQYTDGSGVLLLGPAMSAKWESLDIDVSLGFALAEDIPYDDLNSVVSIGFGYTF